jgi:hypothetical protein
MKRWDRLYVTCFLLLLKEHDSLELRNCVSVSHRLHAIKGGRPTMKVKPNAFKRQPTKTLSGLSWQKEILDLTPHFLPNGAV